MRGAILTVRDFRVRLRRLCSRRSSRHPRSGQHDTCQHGDPYPAGGDSRLELSCRTPGCSPILTGLIPRHRPTPRRGPAAATGEGLAPSSFHAGRSGPVAAM